MGTVMIYDLVGKRVLVTRQSARTIDPMLAIAVAEDEGEVVLDFSGVDGITPSFLDEILAIIEKHLRASQEGKFRVIVANPPTRLSAKFSAVGRGRGLSIGESERGAWIITKHEQK